MITNFPDTDHDRQFIYKKMKLKQHNNNNMTNSANINNYYYNNIKTNTSYYHNIIDKLLKLTNAGKLLLTRCRLKSYTSKSLSNQCHYYNIINYNKYVHNKNYNEYLILFIIDHQQFLRTDQNHYYKILILYNYDEQHRKYILSFRNYNKNIILLVTIENSILTTIIIIIVIIITIKLIIIIKNNNKNIFILWIYNQYMINIIISNIHKRFSLNRNISNNINNNIQNFCDKMELQQIHSSLKFLKNSNTNNNQYNNINNNNYSKKSNNNNKHKIINNSCDFNNNNNIDLNIDSKIYNKNDYNNINNKKHNTIKNNRNENNKTYNNNNNIKKDKMNNSCNIKLVKSYININIRLIVNKKNLINIIFIIGILMQLMTSIPIVHCLNNNSNNSKNFNNNGINQTSLSLSSSSSSLSTTIIDHLSLSEDERRYRPGGGGGAGIVDDELMIGGLSKTIRDSDSNEQPRNDDSSVSSSSLSSSSSSSASLFSSSGGHPTDIDSLSSSLTGFITATRDNNIKREPNINFNSHGVAGISGCHSCQLREQVKADNLASIKRHILIRLEMRAFPNITSPIVPREIIEKFYKNHSLFINYNNNGGSGSDRGTGSEIGTGTGSDILSININNNNNNSNNYNYNNGGSYPGNRYSTTTKYDNMQGDDPRSYKDYHHHHHHQQQQQQSSDEGNDEDYEEEFFSVMNSIYVFPTIPRMRHNKKPDILHFSLTNNGHSTISQAILHIYIRGRDWMRDHDPTILNNNNSRREIILTINRVLRRQNSPNSTHTQKVSEISQTIPNGVGTWVTFDVTEMVINWFDNPNTNHGVVIKTLEQWMRPFVVTDDNPSNKAFALYIEVLTKDNRKRRTKRNTSLNCSESDNEVRCCRYPLEVDFRKFNWDWIIAPSSFNAYFCNGECKLGFLPKYPHTHIMQLSTAPQPCCSPTKMSPISLLYFNNDHNLVMSTIPNMAVDKCSCS